MAQGDVARGGLPRPIGAAMIEASSDGDFVQDGLKRLVAEHAKLTIPKSLDELRHARASGTTMQLLLRKALRQSLDVQIIPVTSSEDGCQQAMCCEDMENIYRREQERMVAYKRRLEEAIIALEKWRLAPRDGDVAEGGPPLAIPRIAIAFWHGPDDNCTLPQHFVDGLASCAMNSGLKTLLLTYQDLNGVPEGVHISAACTFLSEREFKFHLDRGVRVQHLSDYIRALALQRYGGWFVDGDTVWFRKAPVLSAAVTPCLGHFFGSLQAHKKSPRGFTIDQIRRHWNAHYLKVPGDFAYIASPCAFPARSVVLRSWVAKMESCLYGSVHVRGLHPKSYEIFFALLHQAVREEGMVAAIRDFSAVSPIPATMGSSSMLAAKAHLFDLAALPLALCANNYGQTSKTDHIAREAEPGSAWHAALVASRGAAACPSRRLKRKASWQNSASSGVGGRPADGEESVGDQGTVYKCTGEALAACNPKGMVDECEGEPVAACNPKRMVDKCVGEPVAACSPKDMRDKCVGESRFGLPFLSGIVRDPSPESVTAAAACSDTDSECADAAAECPLAVLVDALESVDID